ncbi:hypothetical protein [Sorangium sp. So ce1078]
MFTQSQLVALFEQLPSDAHVVVDAQAARYVVHDVAEIMGRFEQ